MIYRQMSVIVAMSYRTIDHTSEIEMAISGLPNLWLELWFVSYPFAAIEKHLHCYMRNIFI